MSDELHKDESGAITITIKIPPEEADALLQSADRNLRSLESELIVLIRDKWMRRQPLTTSKLSGRLRSEDRGSTDTISAVSDELQKNEETTVQVTVSISSSVYERALEASKLTRRSVEDDLGVIIEAKFPPPKKRGRPPLPKQDPSEAILSELADLAKANYVEKKDDGTYLGVAQSGAGWIARVANVVTQYGHTYLGTYRTKEEAAVVRARVKKTEHDEHMKEWLFHDRIFQSLSPGEDPSPIEAWDRPLPAEPPPAEYMRKRDVVDITEDDLLQYEAEADPVDLVELAKPVDPPPDPNEPW